MPELDRRSLMISAGAVGVAGAIDAGRSSTRTQGVSPTREAQVHQRPIPSSGEMLPVVGFGTWQTFDIGTGEAERTQRRQVLDVLFAAGGRVVDSSPMYGRAETVVGDLLSAMGARDKAFLATKVWTTGKAAGLQQMQASATRLRAPVIDLMQIHNLVDWRTHLETLRAGKAAGRYRYIGITHYTIPALDELSSLLERERLDFVQMGYSLATRAAEQRLLKVAAARGVAVIVNQPFDSGSLFSKVRGKPLPAWAAEIDCASWAQVMLKYILGHPAVTCVIPGTASPIHARDNIAAGLGRLPGKDFRRTMSRAWDAL